MITHWHLFTPFDRGANFRKNVHQAVRVACIVGIGRQTYLVGCQVFVKNADSKGIWKQLNFFHSRFFTGEKNVVHLISRLGLRWVSLSLDHNMKDVSRSLIWFDLYRKWMIGARVERRPKTFRKNGRIKTKTENQPLCHVWTKLINFRWFFLSLFIVLIVLCVFFLDENLCPAHHHTHTMQSVNNLTHTTCQHKRVFGRTVYLYHKLTLFQSVVICKFVNAIFLVISQNIWNNFPSTVNSSLSWAWCSSISSSISLNSFFFFCI